MSLLLSRRMYFGLLMAGLFGVPAATVAQTNYYSANGTEYSVIGSIFGDQVFPDAAVSSTGGFLVWQDNATDGSDWGVSARRLDSTLSGTLSTFRVNVEGISNQENPRVAMLKNGGAVFVWQGGKPSLEQIYARFLTPTNTWLTTNDVLVNTASVTNVTTVIYTSTTNLVTTITTNWSGGARPTISGYTTNSTLMVTTTATTNFIANSAFNINPAVTVLNNSNVVVVWGKFNQVGSTSLQDVYAKILSPTGQTISNEFRVNQFTNYNQRTPTVAALKNGGFVVTWVSEQQRVLSPDLGMNTALTASGGLVVPSVDLYARLYSNGGAAQGNEFIVNTGSNPCSNPALMPASDGGFMVTWGAHDMANPTNSYDIYARPFTSAGVGGAGTRVNSQTYSGQFAPRIAVIGNDYLIVWTSLGQDGSREGVFGQYVHANGSLVGGEFRVNTTTVSQQMHPVIASDGAGQFLAVWTGYAGSPNSFDLFAQRYLNSSAVLQPMSAPFVYAPFNVSNNVYQPQLQVSWPTLLGISVAYFKVYADGSGVPAAQIASNAWTMTAAHGLDANSTHSFQVEYVTTDGRTSPMSPSASGTTWSGLNWGGIPFEWMTQFYGSDISQWPAAGADSDGDSKSTTQEFLSGTVPTNSASVLHAQLAKTGQGMFLSWPTQAGLTYQVQVTTDFTTWNNLGSPRFAAGTVDSIYVGGGSVGYYRVALLR